MTMPPKSPAHLAAFTVQARATPARFVVAQTGIVIVALARVPGTGSATVVLGMPQAPSA